MRQTCDSWADISPKYVADRPVLERRTDPLSEVFGSMSIQEAVYMRLEATAPWGVRYLGDTGPRIRFMLVVRGSALLRFRIHCEPSLFPAAIFSFSSSVASPLH